MFNQPHMNPMNQRQNKPVDNSRLYNILGIDKLTENSSVIKKAYLKKSMRGEYCHPDKGGSNEKFQELSLAYNILKDKEKRDLYNKYGEESLKPDFREPMNMNNLFSFNTQVQRQNNNLEKGQPIIHKLNLSLTELCKGVTKKLKITRKIIINTTNKKIISSKNEILESCQICKKCNGTGIINITRQIGPGMIQQIRTNCDFCKGSCRKLKPQYKVVEKEEIVNVFVEKGMENGDKIKINDKGNMFPGKLPSDIIFVVQELKDKIFQRKGNDLLMKRKISLKDALCGFEFLIKHPEDKYIVIKSNNVIKDNTLRCIENGGMPLKHDNYSYGKLFVMFTVIYPSKQEIKDNLELIKKVLNFQSYNNLNNNNTKILVNSLPENTLIESGTLKDIDPNLFGHKSRYKSANDSDSDDEQMNTERCHTM
mgnify:CR=1 FL=1